MLIRREDITAKIIASSVVPDTGARIDTLQLRYPRIIHAEVLTHRDKSKNASSSRAIPTVSLLARDADIFIPNFRKNKPGMSPGDYLSPEDQAKAAAIWTEMAEFVTAKCRELSSKDGLNVHKQWSNRPLEWFGYIDVVMTATDWANFFHLRDHEAAQDEICLLARAIKEARDNVIPTELGYDEWHLPYLTELDIADSYVAAKAHASVLNKIFEDTELYYLSLQDKLCLVVSAARCCRVSYSKHDGTPSTFEEDIERFLKLVPTDSPVHASPLEHQATALEEWPAHYQGNFRGFAQFRQFIPNHAVND